MLILVMTSIILGCALMLLAMLTAVINGFLGAARDSWLSSFFAYLGVGFGFAGTLGALVFCVWR